MIAPSECAAIVLAAGRSVRFGNSDKLLAPLDGMPLVDHIFNTVSTLGFGLTISVVLRREVAELAVARGLRVVKADGDGLQGDSLRAGISALAGHAFTMIFLGDMPNVTRSHARAMLATAQPGQILATRANGYFGPPVLLPTALLSSVPAEEDRGAHSLLKDAIAIDADNRTVADFDRVVDFQLGGANV